MSIEMLFVIFGVPTIVLLLFIAARLTSIRDTLWVLEKTEVDTFNEIQDLRSQIGLLNQMVGKVESRVLETSDVYLDENRDR